MKLINIRFGFATNSSSTHSIVFLPDAEDMDVEDQEFGWEHFTAASEEAKRAYIGQAVAAALSNSMEGDYERKGKLAAKAASLIVGTNVISGGCIDHQSCIDIPTIGDEINKEYVNDLIKFLTRKDIVILGGNDNDDTPHPLLAGSRELKTEFPIDRFGVICGRKDGQWWTLFDKNTGTKIRFSFEDDPEEFKMSSPDLVDLKITNYCDKYCLYCYQSSTREGQHAEFEYIKAIIDDLSKNKIMEVAIGGGEPTSHPKFVEIIEYCHENGITPNFSTKRLDWLDSESIRNRILSKIGAFAYSVDHPNDMKELYSRVVTYGIDDRRSPRCDIQIVLGTMPPNWLDCIFRNMAAFKELGNYHMGITLLDYKAVGRGASNRKEAYGDWLKEALSHNIEVGIDTPLARSCEKELKKKRVSELLYNTEEGRTSCYIDAVDKKIGPCSYEPDKLESFMVGDWINQFKRFAGLDVVIDPLKNVRHLDLDD